MEEKEFKKSIKREPLKLHRDFTAKRFSTHSTNKILSVLLSFTISHSSALILFFSGISHRNAGPVHCFLFEHSPKRNSIRFNLQRFYGVELLFWLFFSRFVMQSRNGLNRREEMRVLNKSRPKACNQTHT